MIYKIGKETKPRIHNSPLMAFNSVEAAGDWLDGLININKHKVFECTYECYLLLHTSEMHRVSIPDYWI